MLLEVQNTTGELYLEIGMTEEGFHCFQKAWSNLMEFSTSAIKDKQDFVRQKGMADRCRVGNPLCFRVGLLGSSSHQERGGGWEFYGGHVRVDQ